MIAIKKEIRSNDELVSLLERYKLGDSGALDKIIRSVYYVVRLGAIRVFQRGGMDPDDLMQEGLMRLCEKIKSYNGSIKLVSFAYLVAYRHMLNVSIKYRNDHSGEVKTDDDIFENIPIQQFYFDGLFLDYLTNDEERKIIKMHYGYYGGIEYSMEEIGKAVNRSRAGTHLKKKEIINNLRKRYFSDMGGIE